MPNTLNLPHSIVLTPIDRVVIGRWVRTSAADAARDIPALWQRWMSEDLREAAPPGADPARVYAVYCDYQSDANGPYTMVLGYAFDPEAPVPPERRRVRIPAGRYLEVKLEGDPSQVVWRAWSAINDPVHPVRPRRFIADLECYPLASLRPNYAAVELQVGLSEG